MAPVIDLWERLSREGAQAVVVKAVREQLRQIAAWTGPEHAAEALSDRLTWRLGEQGGSALVADPIGWLLTRGLPNRAGRCGEPACDSGVRLDTGAGCLACGMRLTDARALRRRIAVQLAEQMPTATPEERRSALEQRLSEHVAHEQARRAEALRWEAEQRAKAEANRPRRLAEAAAAEAARLVVPCADCQAPQSAGLCSRCSNRRGATAAMSQAIEYRLTMATLRGWDDVNAVVRQVGAEVQDAMRQGRNPDQDRVQAAVSDRVNAEHIRDLAQQQALQLFANSAAATEEMMLAGEAELRRAHLHASPEAAMEAANEAGNRARDRAARDLFNRQLAIVRSLRRRPESVPDQAAELNAAGRERARAATAHLYEQE